MAQEEIVYFIFLDAEPFANTQLQLRLHIFPKRMSFETKMTGSGRCWVSAAPGLNFEDVICRRIAMPETQKKGKRSVTRRQKISF